MTNTPNYQLPQWQLDDFLQMQDFNAAFSALDTALKANADAAAANTAKLAGAGKLCRIKIGTYTGDGVDTANTTRTIACEEFYPLVLLIAERSATGTPLFCIRPNDPVYYAFKNATLHFTWSDHAVSYYCRDSGADKCLNKASTGYVYALLGVDEL